MLAPSLILWLVSAGEFLSDLGKYMDAAFRLVCTSLTRSEVRDDARTRAGSSIDNPSKAL